MKLNGRDRDRNYTDAGIRLSYHDPLDRAAGYLNGAGISLGELRLRHIEDDETRVQSLSIVTLQSLSDRYSQLNSLSWEVSVGLQREPLLQNDRLGFALEGAVGRSRPLSAGGIGYAMIGPSLYQWADKTATAINGHARLGWLNYEHWGAWQTELAVDSLQDNPARFAFKLDANVDLSTNHALRLSLSRQRVQSDNDTQLSLAYRFYF